MLSIEFFGIGVVVVVVVCGCVQTPGCGVLAEGEPNLCANVGAGNAHGANDPFGTGRQTNELK